MLTVTPTAIEAVKIIVPKVFPDARGSFCETYNHRRFVEHGLSFDFVQDNQSWSVEPGTIRGLHFQSHPAAQDKLVRVLRGSAAIPAVARRGRALGMSFSYAEQPRPEGLAQAYIIGADFVAGGASALVLGEFVLRARFDPAAAEGVESLRRRDRVRLSGQRSASLWCRRIRREPDGDLDRGEAGGAALQLGGDAMYFYDSCAVEIAAGLKPSARGELEITDLNRAYLERGQLRVEKMGRGFARLDAGTPDNLLEEAEFVRILEKRQGLKICCPEEIAYHMKWTDAEQLENVAKPIANSAYRRYLARLARL